MKQPWSINPVNWPPQAGVPLLCMLHSDESLSRSIQELSDLLVANVCGQGIAT